MGWVIFCYIHSLNHLSALLILSSPPRVVAYHRPGVTVLGSAATHSSLAEQPDVIAGSLVGFASAIGLLTAAADFEVGRFRLRVGLASDFLSASTAAHAPVQRCGVPNPKISEPPGYSWAAVIAPQLPGGRAISFRLMRLGPNRSPATHK